MDSETKILGVTMGYSGLPTLLFEGGTILFGDAEYVLYPEYFPNGKGTWPVDPETGEKLNIHENPELSDG